MQRLFIQTTLKTKKLMSNLLKKLFQTPEVVNKLTAKEYYEGFKKIFSKIGISENSEESEEENDEDVPRGEAFFYVTDFAFADGQAPLLWVGSLNTEWKAFRKKNQNSGNFAKGYAEKASEINPDADRRDFTFTITDGKAIKETACKAVEKAVRENCSKKINVTVPQVAQDKEQPIATPEQPKKVKKESEAFNNILASFHFYKNIDGLKAPAAKIKARLDLENLIETWDTKKEDKELTAQIQKLQKSLGENLQWQEQLQDLANELRQNEIEWKKCFTAFGGDMQLLKNITDAKKQKQHYLAIRYLLGETISWQLKKIYYFDDEIKAGTLDAQYNDALQSLIGKNKIIDYNCNTAITLLTENNANTAKLKQAFRDLSPKDDIEMVKLDIFHMLKDTKIPKELEEQLAKYKNLLVKTGKNINTKASEIQTELLNLSDWMHKHRKEIPAELRKEIGLKIYKAREEIGLSGHLDSNYTDIVQLFQNFETRKENFLSEWGAGQKPELEKELKNKMAHTSSLKGIINNLENKMRLWESSQADFSSIEIQEQHKNIRRMRRAMAELSALNLGINYKMPDGVARKTYVLTSDGAYKTNGLTTFKTTSDDFIKNAIRSNKTVSWAQFKIAIGYSLPDDTAKTTAIEARVKKLHKQLEKIIAWQVESKKYDKNPDLDTANKYFNDLDLLINKELQELQSARQAILLEQNATRNSGRLERLKESRNEKEKEWQNLYQEEQKKPAKGRPEKMAALELEITQRNLRINNVQNRIVQGGAVLQMQEKLFSSFSAEEIAELKKIATRWQNRDNQAPKDADDILQTKGKTAKYLQDLEEILEIEASKHKIMEATKAKSQEAIKKAIADLEIDYNMLADRLTAALKDYDPKNAAPTITLIKILQKDVVGRMPDAKTIKQSGEQLGIAYYPKLKNLHWHIQRLLKELNNEETIDSITAQKIMDEVGILLNVREDDPGLIPEATAMIEAMNKWQARNTPAQESKDIWTLPKNKEYYENFDFYKSELANKLKQVEIVMKVQPTLLPIFDQCSQEIKTLMRSMQEAKEHPAVKKWLDTLQTEQDKFDNQTINMLTPNLEAELAKINETIDKIRVAYFKAEDDLFRKEETRAFAAYKGGFDIAKNIGFIVPEKELELQKKIYERIINRVNARIKNGEAPEEIQASLAHIPFSFVPDKCVAALAAWQATRKAVLERHFDMKSKDYSAEGMISAQLQEMPEEALEQINQKARNFVEAEEFKQLITDLAEKSPEELDEFIKNKELAKNSAKETMDTRKGYVQTAVDISLTAAKVLQKMTRAAQGSSLATGKIDDSANNLIGNSIAKNPLKDGKVINDAASVGKILGGVCSILSGVIQAISLLKTEPKTNPQTTFDKVVIKSLTTLESLANIGYGTTVIFDALQFGVGEILVGFNLAIDLINVAKTFYSLVKNMRMAIKTQELENVANLEDNALVMAFSQEMKNIEKKIVKDSFNLTTGTMAAAGSAVQIGGLFDPTGSTMTVGQVIRYTAKGVEVAGNLVLAIDNVRDICKAASWIKKAAIGDRNAQIKVMSNCSYYAKMYIAHKAFEGDPLAKKYLIDRNMSATDLENEFTSKSVLQDALLYASDEGGDTFWFNPADGELTNINKQLFENFAQKTSEKISVIGVKLEFFVGITASQTYENLQKMGLVSEAGLQGLFANYVKFKSKKINKAHPIRAYHNTEFTNNLKSLYVPVKKYHQHLIDKIADATKSGSLAQINHATRFIETIEQEANEIERILQLFEIHKLAA